MLRILLIDDTPRKVGRLRKALSEGGFEVLAETDVGVNLPERVAQLKPDVILIDTDSPGRDVIEQICVVTRDQPRAVVLFTEDDSASQMRQAIAAGVSAYIVKGIDAKRLHPILDVAMARFDAEQALREQLRARDRQLQERARIDQAKAILMKLRNCDENTAYTLMRKQAMNHQKKLIEVAEQIVQMADLIAPDPSA